MVTLHTNFGDIKIKLDFDKAPVTAENFLNYCKDGFYNNTIFHRVIDGFMIQGGGMESGMREIVQKKCLVVKSFKNGAMQYLVKWLKGWMLLIKSKKWKQATKAFIKMFQLKM